MYKWRDIWVILEKDVTGRINKSVFGLISKAYELNRKLNNRVTGISFGELNKRDIDEAIRYGIDEIIELESNIKDSSFSLYGIESEMLYKSILELKPLIVVALATNYGRTLMPLVSSMLETGLTADCTELAIDGENLVQIRPAFGGNIMAEIICPKKRPQMATVRPGIFQKCEVEEQKSINVKKLSYDFNLLDILPKIINREVIRTGSTLTDASIIIAGGRGLGRPEGFELLKHLAKRIGGVVGASRGAVDLGWIDHSHQVGQTGYTVSPKLYIACGISGAIQHIAGMKDSDVIIAINEDPQAPIFEIADYGIVGDLYEVIPAILEEL